MDITWQAVDLGRWFVALGLPLLLLAVLRRPRRWRWRVPVVVLVSWVALMLYTTEVYFRFGVQRAMQQGADNPYYGFDNNNLVPVLVLGWLLPFFSCCMAAITRFVFQSRGGRGRAAAA